jgi:hypothetical protein
MTPQQSAQPEHPALDRSLEQLRRIGDANFLHHVGAMGFDGFHADSEPLADLLVLEPRPNEFKNLLLATGQRFGPFFPRRRLDGGFFHPGDF